MDDTFKIESTPKVPVFNKLAYWLLLVATALVPVFFLPISFISVQFGTSLMFSFAVILSAVLYIVSAIANGSLNLPTPSKYILGFTALVPFTYTLAGISNGFSRMSFFGYTFDINAVGFILLAFVYMFLVSVLFATKEKLSQSYRALSVSGVLLGLFVLVRVLSKGKLFSFGIFNQVTSTMLGSWNNIALVFGAMALISLVSLQMLSLSKVKKILVWGSLVASLFFLVLANFTSIWWTLAVFSFMFILYCVFSFDNTFSPSNSLLDKIKRAPVLPVALLVISLVFAIWHTNLGSFLATKLGAINIEVRPSFSTTVEIAKNTLRDKPLFGSGPNTFVTQWSAYKPSDIVGTIFWDTDFSNGIGLIPTLAVTTGVIGLLSWLVFFGFFVYVGFKSMFAKLNDESDKYSIVASFFSALFLWVASFIYVPGAPVLVLAFFITGVFFASIYSAGIVELRNKQFNSSPKLGFASSLIMVASLVAVLSLGYGLYKNSISLWYFQKSSYALNTSKDSKMAEDYMLKAILAVPNDVYYRSLSEIEIYKLNELLSQDLSKVNKEDLQKQFNDGLSNAIKAAISAKDKNPNNYQNWVSLGKVYDAVSNPQLNITGAYESAQLAYAEAFKRNPKNPGILMLAARMAANRNDLAAADSYARQATQIKSNYLDAYFLLSQIEVATKNINGAIQSVTAASIIDPTNPAVFFQLGLLKYNIADFNGAIVALEKARDLTPNYANAKFFLGLSYEVTKQHEKAIKEFEDLKVSNPDSKEVDVILSNLKEGKPIFTDASTAKPEKGKELPLKEKQ